MILGSAEELSKHALARNRWGGPHGAPVPHAFDESLDTSHVRSILPSVADSKSLRLPSVGGLFRHNLSQQDTICLQLRRDLPILDRCPWVTSVELQDHAA